MSHPHPTPLLLLFLAASPCLAYSLHDGFTAGADPRFWSLTQTSAAIYSINTALGDVRIAKTANNPGGLNYAGLQLNLPALGGPVTGDFSTSVDFSNAVVGATAYDQIELHTYYQDTSVFFVVRDNSFGQNFHV